MTNSDFLSTLKADFKSLALVINNQGFKVGIIGGCVRDFHRGILKADSFHDYDCELRPIQETTDLLENFRALKKILASKYKTRELPFEILRIFGDNFEAELSLPRLESFTDDFHHSNFEATFIHDLEYSAGFLRRDITLNAMMFEVVGEEAIFRDPLAGLRDLKKQLIKPCCESTFGKDPVRFLRALRFKILLSQGGEAFRLDQKIQAAFKNLNLDDFNPHYLSTEMFKSQKPLTYLLDLSSLLGIELSLSKKVVNHFDNLWMTKKKNIFFTNALFLPKTFSDLISEKFQLKQKRNLAPMPWSFQKEVVDSDWIAKFEFLRGHDMEVVEFYYNSDLIDLSFVQLEEVSKIKVDLSEIANNQKKEFKYREQIRIYFENQNNK